MERKKETEGGMQTEREGLREREGWVDGWRTLKGGGGGGERESEQE